MDAYTTEPFHDSYFNSPPVLIAGDSEAALRRAARTVAGCGLRVGASLSLEDAPQRLAMQASTSAVWLELDRDGGPAMDSLLLQVDRETACGRYAAVVATTRELLDPIFSRITSPAIDVVVDGSDADRAAALALATSGVHRPEHVSDVASDQSAERLRQLSDEVSRIASTLARLSTGPGTPQKTVQAVNDADVPQVSPDVIRSVIRARRLRSRFFEEELFADPAWDMLLDLLQAEIAQLRVPVSSLCIAAAVPATTALRWLKTMTDKGLFVRRADPHDGRRIFVELAPATSVSMRRYFAEVGAAAVV